MDDIVVVDYIVGPQVTPYKRRTTKIEQAEVLLKKVIRNLKSKLYHYIYALDVFEFVAVKEKIELSTDGIHIYYNPDDVIAMYRKNSRQLELQIAHMMVHGLLGHFEELSQFRHKKLVGAIMDAQVEKLLIKMGVRELPADVYDDAMNRVMKTDFYGYEPYYEASKSKRLRMFWLGNRKEFRRDDHSFWQWDVMRAYFKTQTESMQGDGEGSSTSKQDAGSESNENKKLQQHLKDVWGKARAITFGSDAISSAEGCIHSFSDKSKQIAGVGAGNSDVFVEPAKEGNRYDDIIKEFLKEKEQCTEDVNAIDRMLYTYGMELYGDVPLVEPNEVNETLQLNHLFVAIDTSGSCGGEVASQFVRETCNILQDVRDSVQFEKIHLIQCDYVIQKEEEYSSIEDLEDAEAEVRELRGFGGTSFLPVFQRIEDRMKEEDIQVDALIYLTDSYGEIPEKKPEYPVFFAMPKDCFLDNGEPRNGNIPDWIQCIRLDAE